MFIYSPRKQPRAPPLCARCRATAGGQGTRRGPCSLEGQASQGEAKPDTCVRQRRAEQQEGGARGGRGNWGEKGWRGPAEPLTLWLSPGGAGSKGTGAGDKGSLPGWGGGCGWPDRHPSVLAGSRPPSPAGPAPPGAAAPALAMPVMSALPARKVKGAGANHSPSVLPAGIRQRRGSGAALPAK